MAPCVPQDGLVLIFEQRFMETRLVSLMTTACFL